MKVMMNKMDDVAKAQQSKNNSMVMEEEKRICPKCHEIMIVVSSKAGGVSS